MSLVKCPNCGRTLVTTAPVCVDCGHHMHLQAEQVSQRPQGIEYLLFRIKNWWDRVKRHAKHRKT
jgi:uncharacterized OB-fold protein